jgi:hypothetical protein
MATTISLTKVTIVGDRYTFTFADGMGIEFSSFAELTQFLDEFDDPNQNGPENARLLCMSYLRKRSADFSQLNSVLGKSFILDLGHANPIRVVG